MAVRHGAAFGVTSPGFGLPFHGRRSSCSTERGGVEWNFSSFDCDSHQPRMVINGQGGRGEGRLWVRAGSAGTDKRWFEFPSGCLAACSICPLGVVVINYYAARFLGVSGRARGRERMDCAKEKKMWPLYICKKEEEKNRGRQMCRKFWIF